MSGAMSLSQEARQAVQESARWRLAALLFERPKAGWRNEIESIAESVDDAALRDTLKVALEDDTSEGEYLRLFGPGGAVSPREAGYGTMRDPGRMLADVKGFYEAFAFRPQTEDPLDHVSVEAGFVGYMKLKTAFALECGRGDEAEVTRQATRLFLEQHLAGLAGELADRVCGAAPPASPWLVAGKLIEEMTAPFRSAVTTSHAVDPTAADEESCFCDGSC